jgi:hypothetical protein
MQAKPYGRDSPGEFEIVSVDHQVRQVAGGVEAIESVPL